MPRRSIFAISDSKVTKKNKNPQFLTETVNCDLRSSLLTLGIADASIALLSLNRSLQLSTMKCLTYPPSLCHSLYKDHWVIYHLPFYAR
jgi:hypothetical protein